MIISNKFLRAHYGRPLRDFLRQNAAIHQIVDLAGLPVFRGVTVRMIVLLTSRGIRDKSGPLYVPPVAPDVFQKIASGLLSVEQASAESSYRISPEALTRTIWSFAKSEAGDLIDELKERYLSLTQYCEGQIFMGIKSGLTEAFVIDAHKRAAILKRNSRAEEIINPFINGRDVRRYNIEYKNIYIIYTYHGIDINRYPAIEDHLLQFKDRLQKRATRQAWFELQQPQYNFAAFMAHPKIVFPDIATAPRFSLDEKGYYSSNTTYFMPKQDLYLLGLLNSSLGWFYFVNTCAGLEGKHEKYLRFFGQYLEGFPVHQIRSSDRSNVVLHDRIVELVDKMTKSCKQLRCLRTPYEKESVKRQIEATDRQIDQLVYELYDLTPEEIRIVEGTN